jgi:hypothetical protein
VIGSHASTDEILELLYGISEDLRELPHRVFRNERNAEMRAFLDDLENRAAVIRINAVNEIERMFAEAFPNRWFIFLVQRPRDLEGGVPPWPLMLRDRERAERYEDRVTSVLEVRF